jgi:hypothetical protein
MIQGQSNKTFPSNTKAQRLQGIKAPAIFEVLFGARRKHRVESPSASCNTYFYGFGTEVLSFLV